MRNEMSKLSTTRSKCERKFTIQSSKTTITFMSYMLQTIKAEHKIPSGFGGGFSHMSSFDDLFKQLAGQHMAAQQQGFQSAKPQQGGNRGGGFLDQFGRNLTNAAKAGLIDPVIGRDEEIERVIEILNRRNKNNPVLIGEPGVGKTAIVEGLALKITEGDVPQTIK